MDNEINEIMYTCSLLINSSLFDILHDVKCWTC